MFSIKRMIVKNKILNLIFLILIFLFTVKVTIAGFISGKPYYKRHEVIKIYSDNEEVLYLKVYKKGERFHPFEDMDKIYFQPIGDKLKVAYFPLGFKPPLGKYTLRYYSKEKKIGESNINIYSRKINKIESPSHTFTVEYGGNLNSIKVGVPNKKGYSNKRIKYLLEYLNIDNLFFMVGQTNAKLKIVYKKNPWIKEYLESWEKFNSKFEKDFITGGYTGCFLCFGPAISKFPQYEFSYDYSFEYGLYKTNFVSIDDRKRINDIKNLSKKIANNDQIEYVGLDYIRAGQGGFENYKEFSRIFDINIKGDSNKEKILNLAKLVKNNNKPNIRKKWEYFRAYKTSKVIEEIAKDIDKPLWVFNLGWEQGHNHGQDPIMFTDAGADVIFVMLYEANYSEYNDMMKSWDKYLSDVNNLQLVTGQVIDYPLNDNIKKKKSGPEEMLRRYKYAYDVFSQNDNLKGFFLHDLVRAYYGRLYPYTTKEWLYASGSAISYYDTKSNRFELSLKAKKKERKLYFTIKNDYNKKIRIGSIVFKPKYWQNYKYEDVKIESKSSAVFEIPYKFYKRKMGRQFVTMIFEFKGRKFFKTLYFDSIN